MAIQPETTAVSLREYAQKTQMIVCAVVPVILLNACTSDLVLATWITTCKQSVSTGRSDSGSNDAGAEFSPWSTSFENAFCDYSSDGNGSCYTTNGAASYDIVDAPVHSGHYAAAFTVFGRGTDADIGTNSRCHRDGELPREAYYGAWYYIPSLVTNSDNWNLFHFQGPDSTLTVWDVSLVNNDTGGLRLAVFSPLPNTLDLSRAPAVPIATWFHIVLYIKRASDDTGAIALYQDGVQLAQATNLTTYRTTYGQWYVGNLATNLDPPESTLYVDDVSVGPEL